ncbi:hypothetical protein XA68_17302 [Ophiocordyceps unilateralis]|uniref:Glycosyl hydrolase family 13 catalytic domain-containing protein n=1 Tax=Ophiocordyceps unilateralis TaxID=268505 RepID=A0A2A9PKB5_OPHUN|nr:hypothetical protein XA68_17302 [Ophiocordyceps unilateralis]
MKPSTLLSFVIQLSVPALAADATAWKSRSIYFALTDRIARNTTDGDRSPCYELGRYCGGTFSGLESKLDYIKDLGFDAIWISPVIKNHDGGYHGYWAQDLYSINPNFGTADELKSLVNAAHSKDMYVMVDVVANHMGGPISQNRPEPLNQDWSYHTPCMINYGDQGSVEYCQIGGLPDLDTRNPQIRQLLYNWIHWLVEEFRFDGLRIDTVKHVEKDFWSGFSAAAGVFTIGEAFDHRVDVLAGYSHVMSSLLNYAVFHPLNDFYMQRGSSQTLINTHDAVSWAFSDPSVLGTFIDNHDNPRWLSQKNDHALLKNALTYVLLARGIPIVYYATEQGYAGGHDPANRESLWHTNFDTKGDLYRFISRVSRVRKAAGGLPQNDHVHLMVEDTGYAWSRAGGDVIALTSNIGSGNSREYCLFTRRPHGVWKDVFEGKGYTADERGWMCAHIYGGNPIILVSA